MTLSKTSAQWLSLLSASALILAPTLMSAGGAQAMGWGFGKKAPEPVVVAPPPPPPAPPPVALSSKAVEAASAYRAYVRRLSAMSGGFTDGPSIETSLATGATSEPQQLARGAVAFSALMALQDPAFVAGVRTYAIDPAVRATVAQRVIADPNYAGQMPGAATAAALIIAAETTDAARVALVGRAVKQSAYDIQHKKWSTQMVPDRDGRLARTKTAGHAPMTSSADEVAELTRAVSGADNATVRMAPVATAQPAPPPYSPAVAHALAVATLAALGVGGDADDAQVEALLNEQTGAFCFNMSKLNLNQCLAVAKPYYEDVFCLGQHVLIDTGQCLSRSAGGAPPTTTASVSPPSAPMGATSSIAPR